MPLRAPDEIIRNVRFERPNISSLARDASRLVIMMSVVAEHMCSAAALIILHESGPISLREVAYNDSYSYSIRV